MDEPKDIFEVLEEIETGMNPDSMFVTLAKTEQAMWVQYPEARRHRYDDPGPTDDEAEYLAERASTTPEEILKDHEAVSRIAELLALNAAEGGTLRDMCTELRVAKAPRP